MWSFSKGACEEPRALSAAISSLKGGEGGWFLYSQVIFVHTVGNKNIFAKG